MSPIPQRYPAIGQAWGVVSSGPGAVLRLKLLDDVGFQIVRSASAGRLPHWIGEPSMNRYVAPSLIAAALFVTACSREAVPTAPNHPKSTPDVSPVTGAAFTTINSSYDAVLPITIADLCKNGNPDVNCNIYGSKDYVWLNGGPSVAYVGNGTYFFAVLQPGGQADPNDGSANNLSDVSPTTSTGAGDVYTNRTFTVSGGTVTYSGSHIFDGNKIRLMGYDDTGNPGGVYILAICSLATGYPVTPSRCKYDAFKVHTGGTETLAEDPTVIKDATPVYDRSYTWGIAKSVVGSSSVQQASGSHTFTYQVVVTNTGSSVSNVKVTGTITVFNPNAASMVATITDALDGTACSVTGGVNATLATGSNPFAYSCDLGTTIPTSTVSNKATATWGAQTVGTLALAAGSVDWTVPGIDFTAATVTSIDNQVSVSDLFNSGTSQLIGVLVGSGTSTVTIGESPKTFTYSRSIPVLTGCHTYPNVATYTTNTTGTTGSSNASVTLCGPAHTGALTQGFWKGPNGTNLITNYCAPSGGTSLATYLSTLGGGAATGPFAAAAGKTCSQLVTYFGTIFGQSATDMNKMLKLQMLATSLDVYFSSLGYSTTPKTVAGKTIKPPSNFLPNGGIGTFTMDLTAICPMVDNTTTGTATCAGLLPSTNGYASGAFPWSSRTVSGILTFAASAPSAGAFTDPTWYYTNRTKQEILKNVFDQINNNLAFAP